MSPTDYILVGMIVPVLLYAAVSIATVFLKRPAEVEENTAESDEQLNRWRRFRISPTRLFQGGEATTALQEEPSGLVLKVVGKGRGPANLKIGTPSGELLVHLRRRRLAFRPTIDVQLRGEPWLRLRSSIQGEFPELRPLPASKGEHARPELAAGDLDFQGDLARREYEVREAGRLVASVSWQEGTRSRDAGKDDYYMEVVRNAPVEALVALALALEVYDSIDGALPEREAGETENGADAGELAPLHPA